MKESLSKKMYAALAVGQDFLQAHHNLFTHRRYQPGALSEKVAAEADAIRRDLNKKAKTLIAQGGKVPSVLYRSEKLIEDLELLFNAPAQDGLFTHYQVLDHGRLDLPTDPEQTVNLLGYLALRTARVVRRFPPPPEKIRDPNERVKLETVKISTLNDCLLLMFELRGKLAEAPADLGWLMPEKPFAEMMREFESTDNELLEGFIRRQYTVAEGARRASQNFALQLPRYGGSLALTSEVRPDTDLHQGVRPSFLSGEIAFGNVDITELEPYQDHREKIAEPREDPMFRQHHIRQQVVSALPFLIQKIAEEAGPPRDDGMLRGQRAGLSLSEHYKTSR